MTEKVRRQHPVIDVELADQLFPVAMRASQPVKEQDGRAIAAVQIPELVTVQHCRMYVPSGHGHSLALTHQ